MTAPNAGGEGKGGCEANETTRLSSFVVLTSNAIVSSISFDGDSLILKKKLSLKNGLEVLRWMRDCRVRPMNETLQTGLSESSDWPWVRRWHDSRSRDTVDG